MIHYNDHLDHTPAMALALEGQIELITKLGYPARALIQDAHRVIWMDDKRGKPAACIIYEKDQDGSRPRFWVWLSYTRPDHRRKQLHNTLWRALERLARRNGIEVIAGGIRSDNEPMARAAVRNGREVAYCVYTKQISKSKRKRAE